MIVSGLEALQGAHSWLGLSWVVTPWGFPSVCTTILHRPMNPFWNQV
jgi:hypothetical protein